MPLSQGGCWNQWQSLLSSFLLLLVGSFGVIDYLGLSILLILLIPDFAAPVALLIPLPAASDID